MEHLTPEWKKSVRNWSRSKDESDGLLTRGAKGLVSTFYDESEEAAVAGRGQSGLQLAASTALGGVADLIGSDETAKPSEYQIGTTADPLTEQMVRIAPEIIGDDLGRKLYERGTGRKYYTAEEIRDIEDPLARERIEDAQDSIITNVADDLSDLAIGIPSAVVAAGAGAIKSVKEGYAAGGVRGAAKELAGDTADVVGELGAASFRSLRDTINDPDRKLADEPLGFLADAAALAGVGGALKAPTVAGKVAGVAGELSPIPLTPRSVEAVQASAALSPTRLGREGVAALVERFPAATDAVQTFLDPKAGVSAGAISALDDYKLGKEVTRSSLYEKADELIKQIPVEDRGLARDLLAGERSRAVLPDWPSRLSHLKREVKGMVKAGAMTAEQAQLLADQNPKALDQAVARWRNAPPTPEHLQSTAESISEALGYRDLQVIDTNTGKDLTSLGFMLYGQRVDPTALRIEINPTSTNAAKAGQMVEQLEGIRQVYATLAEAAADIDLGNGRKLLPQAALERHLGYYMPDTYKSGVVSGASELFSDIDSGSQFTAAKVKNRTTFNERIKLGAEADLERAVKLSVLSEANDIEKFKLFDRLSKSTDGTVLSKADYDNLPPAAQNRYVYIKSDDYLPGSDIPRYGALSGRAVNRNVFRLMENTDQALTESNRLAQGLNRFRSIFGSAKVVLNPASWFNNYVGNLQHNLIDGGLVGAGRTLTEQSGKVLARGFGLLKNDEYFKAAKRAGILGVDATNELGEAMQLEHFVKRRGALKGMADYLIEGFRTAKEKGRAEEFVLRPMEVAMRDNPVMRKIHQAFSAADHASKMSIFERYIKRQAAVQKRNPVQMLQDPEVLRQAAAHIHKFHFDYADVPLAFTKLDRLAILPFARYGWKSIGAAMNVAVQNPNAFKAATAGDDLSYERMSEEERRRVNIQPGYTIGRRRPITDTKDLNMRYMTPYGRIQDLLSIKESGTIGPEQFREKLPVPELLSGPFGALAQIWMLERDPMTGQDIPEVKDQLKKTGYLLGPGAAYHLNEKIIPAFQGTEASRRRKMTPGQAVLHALGIRVEETDVNRTLSGIERGFNTRIGEIERRLKRELESTTDPEEQAEYRAKARADALEATERFKALVNAKR
jgi:hypothetical protein